jgi:plastocyanin
MTPKWIIPIVAALMVATSISARAATIQISMENLVTARNGDWDVTIPPKKTVTSVLKKAGTIEYYCRFHPNMKATLTIAP